MQPTDQSQSLIEQLETLNAYVSPAVAKQAMANPTQQPGGTWRRFHAATVFADISGFTPLAEKMAAIGVRGAEELTAILNEVFAALITVAEEFGGPVEIVKFGGDALSLVWPCQPDEPSLTEAVLRAISTAWAMQASMARFSTIDSSQGSFSLRMKIGISAGEVLEVHAGGVFDRWEYVLAGAPMVNMSQAENHASADEIVVDETVWQLISSWRRPDQPAPSIGPQLEPAIQGTEVAPGYYRLTHFRIDLPHLPADAIDWVGLDQVEAARIAAILRGYIPGAISSILESGRKDLLAELKPMTVCFVGFDGIDYDTEADAGSRLSNFMRDAQKMIYHYEGSVNKLAVGDKGSVLLVLFGAPPFFHEDDEVRGVACALALQNVGAQYNLNLRVGLTAGPLFAGPMGPPQRREYTVVGDLVNLAARLMQRAGPGEIWVDHTVQRKATRFFEYQDLGELTVKGKAEPRRIYGVLREKEHDSEELVMTYLLSNQELTGRDQELAAIDHLADQVWAGQERILLLSGEAGVGKSRLAAEIVRRWMMRGGVSHGGDCVSYGRQTPYLPWRSVLSSLAGLSARLSVSERLDRLERLLRRLPEPDVADPASNGLVSPGHYWLERLPLLAEMIGLEMSDTDLTTSLDEGLRRDNLFALVRGIILQEARSRPTLILLEDIHWSDELSLALIHHLAVELTEAPLFLVLAYRPMSEPIPPNYQPLAALPNTAKLEVNELDPEASLKLVQRKLEVSSLPQALADFVLKKGQGNPFFIEELINSLLSMGVLKVENGQCQLSGSLDELEMPDTVQRVVLARIDRLPEEEKVTLKIAAVIGRSFQRDLLEKVHPWLTSETSLSKHLLRLQAEDFTRREGGENDLDFLFKHIITREVAYETMLYAQRRQLHAVIGAALESRAGENNAEVIDLLAYHYALSDDQAKALYYLHRAGQKALLGNANEAAISYFSQALKIADETDQIRVKFELLAGRERAYDRLGNRLAQTEDLRLMEQLTAGSNQGPQAILQQLETDNRRMLLLSNLGQYAQAIEIAETMLTLARAEAQTAWEARILSNVGIICWRQGDYLQARQATQQSLNLANQVDDYQLKATCFNYLGLIHTRLADYAQAWQDYQQALQLYCDMGDRAGEAACANNLGLLEASLGRYQAAQQQHAQALSICRTIGDRHLEGISLNLLGSMHLALGNTRQAQTYLERSLTIRQAIGDRRGEAFCLHDLGRLHLALAEPERALEQFEAACKLRSSMGEEGNYFASLAAKGQAAFAAGRLQVAGEALQAAVTHLRRGGGSGEYPTQQIWWYYARWCAAAGRPGEAHQARLQAYQLVMAQADQIRDPAYRQGYLEQVELNAEIVAAWVQNRV